MKFIQNINRLKFFVWILLINTFSLNAQFEEITTNTTQSLNYISIIDSNVLVGGNYSYILKTTDLFQNSHELNPPISNSSTCRSYRIDTTTLFSKCKIGSSTLIYKSINDGETWDLKLNMDSLAGQGFNMFDSLNGILVCLLNKCLITNDGGDTWHSEWLQIQNPFVIEGYGDSTACVGTVDGFSITKNKGESWTTNGVLAFSGVQRNFNFLNKDTIYAVTQPPAWDGFMSFTLDHGQTWTNKYFTGENYINPYDVYFLTVDEGYVVGDSSTDCRILKTLDRGETWEVIKTGLTGGFFRIEFANDSIAFIAGTNGMLVKWNKNSNQAELLSIEANKLGISIYPNPSSTLQTLKIETSPYQNISIDLVDVSGKLVKKILETKINQHSFELEQDISSLQSGTYFYKIQLDNLTKTISFVKE